MYTFLHYATAFVLIIFNVSRPAQAWGSFANIFDCLSKRNDTPKPFMVQLKQNTHQEILGEFAAKYLSILEKCSTISIQAHTHYKKALLKFAAEPDICLLAFKNGMRYLLNQTHNDREFLDLLETITQRALLHKGFKALLTNLQSSFHDIKTLTSTEALDFYYTNLLSKYLRRAPSTEELFKVLSHVFLINSGINETLENFSIMDYVSSSKIPQIFTTWFALINMDPKPLLINPADYPYFIAFIVLTAYKNSIDYCTEELSPLFLNTFQNGISKQKIVDFTEKTLCYLKKNLKHNKYFSADSKSLNNDDDAKIKTLMRSGLKDKKYFLDRAVIFLEYRLIFQKPSEDLYKAMLYYALYIPMHKFFENLCPLNVNDFPEDVLRLFNVPAFSFFEISKDGKQLMKLIRGMQTHTSEPE